MKWRYGGTSDSFSVDMSTWLTDRGLTLGEITSAIYMVKATRDTIDANALATLTIGAGITKVPAVGNDPDKLAFSFSAIDFGTGKLEVNSCDTPYYTGMGIKTSGMTTYLEIDFTDDRLTIISDFIHDN